MPRSRGSEVPQRQSPRGPHQLRTSSSDSDPLHHRPITERSPKLGDRRSPRGTQPETLNQKKLGTRIADLESQLGQAQEDLKILKEQLASAEAARKEAQEELEKKAKKPVTPEPEKLQDKCRPANSQEATKTDSRSSKVVPEDNQQETDVFEVPVEKMAIEVTQPGTEMEKETKPFDASAPAAISEPEKPAVDELAVKNDEIVTLKSKLEEKEKEVLSVSNENESLKNQLIETFSKLSSAQAKEEEMTLRMTKVGEDLEASQTNADKLNEKVKSVEGEKEALESEMKKMKVQTEQWKKAADAAAAVLAGGVEMNARISNRCSSMDKHFNGMFETPGGGYNGFVGSPGMADDQDDGYGTGKRKGSGIRMFGELWKKKGNK